MRFRWVLPVLLCCALGHRAAAAGPSDDPDKLKAAAESFDAGRKAYKNGQFDEAAAFFENAFRDAPRPEPLRMAIKARREAGQLARAATLCARADALYGDDPDTKKLTTKVLEEVAPKLYELKVQCEPSCTLALDDRLVSEQPATTQVLYADPGTHKLAAGWRGAPAESKVFNAAAGASGQLSFKKGADEAAPAIHINASDTQPEGRAETPASAGGLSPVFFVVGAGVTAVVGGVAIWSGVDTQNNPGPDTVRKNCAGLGPDCPEYQDGIAKERRTNYLWIGTAAAGVATGVLAIFTDWSSGRKTTARRGVEPTVGYAGGLTLGAVGRF